MKTKLFLLTILWPCLVNSAVTIYKTVPFNNVKMHRNDTIIANYNFKNDTHDHANHLEIFCSDPSLTNVGKATWTYHNQVKSQKIPILLKIREDITGEWADPVGTITIVDTKKKDEDGDFIFMSCNFFG